MNHFESNEELEMALFAWEQDEVSQESLPQGWEFDDEASWVRQQVHDGYWLSQESC